MKLRNKRTGKIVELEKILFKNAQTEDLLKWNTYEPNVNSIAELNKEWEDYEDPAEPDPSFLIVKIQKLENSVKALDERLKAQTEKMGTLRDGINELHDRLKTVEEKLLDLGIKMADAEDDIAQLKEEPTERPHREDNERIIGEVKQYEPTMPKGATFERMKQDLRDWIKKNKIDKIRAFYYSDPAGRRGVLFEDKTNAGDNTLIILGWPIIGLKDGGTYTPDELLITGEAGKE